MKYIHKDNPKIYAYKRMQDTSYCVSDWWNKIIAEGIMEDYLHILGFQPVEETTNDWIDEACTEYMNNEALAFQNNNTFDTEKSFRQAIEKHMPKQELIQLDVEKVMNEICKHSTEWKLWERCDYEIIKQILSKYGTTPQKKFTRLEIEKVVWKYEKDSWDDYQAGKLKWAEEILIHMWLLEE